MEIIVKDKKIMVPGCITKGTFLDGPMGLRPWCTKEGCQQRKRCLAAEGEVPGVGIFFGERMPGRSGSGRL